ncbi:MAG: glycerate kinase [Actinomycetota bacterium]
MREDLRRILDAGLAAADPAEAVRRHLRVENGGVLAGDASFKPRRVFVLAAGKAAGAMARAAEEVLGDRIAGGLVVTKHGHEAASERLDVLFAAHPEPDESSVEAARRAEELARSLGEDDLLLALISGGASALLADPTPPVGIADLKSLTGDLLRSGASIGEINAIRKHISVLKGGGLVRLAAPAQTLALLLSDVVGDDLSSIASGLTAPDTTTLDDVRAIVDRYSLSLPDSVRKHLEGVPETPKPGDEVFERVVNVLVGGARPTAEAAAEAAREAGYEPLLLSTFITGEARAVAGFHAAVVREVLESGNPLAPPCALVTGGEATVVVRGEGRGGPNGEFSLALALELEGVEGWAAFAVDTDGNDGPTEAAGGIVDGRTAGRIREGGVEPLWALEENDAHAALEAGGALLFTGPTGTNVNDLRVVLVAGGRGSAGGTP